MGGEGAEQRPEWKLGQGTMVWARQRSPAILGGSVGRSEREAQREGAEIMVQALLLCDPG